MNKKVYISIIIWMYFECFSILILQRYQQLIRGNLEKKFIFYGLLLLILLASYAIWRRSTIEKDKVFVLAKVTRVSVGGENGPVLYFYYRYNNIKYSNSMSGFFHIQDSLVFIKISKSKPALWTYTDIEIPNCLLDKSKLDSAWEEVPFCY